MKYKIEYLEDKDNNLGKIEELAKSVDENYCIKKECSFIIAKNGDDKFYGVVGFYFKRQLYPELKHVILREGVSRRIGIIMISKLEELLRQKKEKMYVAFVSNKNNQIQQFATRIGFQPYKGTETGVWFCKELTNRRI